MFQMQSLLMSVPTKEPEPHGPNYFNDRVTVPSPPQT